MWSAFLPPVWARSASFVPVGSHAAAVVPCGSGCQLGRLRLKTEKNGSRAVRGGDCGDKVFNRLVAHRLGIAAEKNPVDFAVFIHVVDSFVAVVHPIVGDAPRAQRSKQGRGRLRVRRSGRAGTFAQ